MGRALGVVWQGMRDLYDDLFPFVGMNLIWLIPSAALAAVFGLLLGLALLVVSSYGKAAPEGDMQSFVYTACAIVAGFIVVIGPNPAAAGIHYFANRKVNDERLEFSLVWEGFRLYWKKALALFLISMGGIALLLLNIVFYLSRDDQALGVVAMIFVWILLIWLMMQMYALPLLMEQESKSLRLVIRNCAVLTLANPGFSIILFIVVLLLTTLSIGITVIVSILAGSLIALIEQHAVIVLLERYRSAKRG